MLKVVNIDNNHHIVRHCKKKLLIRKDDEIIGVYPEFLHYFPAHPQGGSN
jgi:hypothetical protein